MMKTTTLLLISIIFLISVQKIVFCIYQDDILLSQLILKIVGCLAKMKGARLLADPNLIVTKLDPHYQSSEGVSWLFAMLF